MKLMKKFFMTKLLIPQDAFSHGQIKSKIWLNSHLSKWAKTLMQSEKRYSLHWHGSWVGVGPFYVLQNADLEIKETHLYDIDSEALEVSKKLLNYWYCEGRELHFHNIDVREATYNNPTDLLIINTSCEHISDTEWLINIPSDSWVLLQSTNMEHIEHINICNNLNEFKDQVSKCLTVLDAVQMDINYPDKMFSRYMIFGQKK